MNNNGERSILGTQSQLQEEITDTVAGRDLPSAEFASERTIGARESGAGGSTNSFFLLFHLEIFLAICEVQPTMSKCTNEMQGSLVTMLHLPATGRNNVSNSFG